MPVSNTKPSLQRQIKTMIRSSVQTAQKLPLRLILVVPFVLQIFTAVSLVGYLSFKNGQKAVNELADQLIVKVNGLVDQHLDTYLAVPRQINQINVDATNLGMLNLENFQTTGRYFWQQMQVFNVGYISFANPQGEFIGVERLDGGSLLINEVSQEKGIGKLYVYNTNNQGDRQQLIAVKDYNPHVEAWYADAVKVGKPIWSQIYSWEDKPEVLSISASYPINDSNNKFVGVISVDLILSQINSFLANLKVGQTGQIFILERSGMIVASSTSEAPYKVISGKAQRLSAHQSQNYLLRETTDYLQQKFGQLKNVKNYQETVLQLRHERHFVQVRPWKDKLGLDWLVIVVVPESDFMAQINTNNRTTVLLCLGALIIATAMGVYTSRWIARPIVQLTQASSAIASGNLDQEVTISGLKELSMLATSFNQMAGQLRDSFAELEKTNQELENRVAERTAEITAAKETADAANRAKSEFLANMSHELRTPLNGILGYAQILQMDSNTSDEQMQGLNTIYECGSHLLTLINDILDIAKIEAKKLELYPKEFDLRKLLLGACEMCRIKADQKELIFKYHLNHRIPANVFADEKRIRQVLINILSNAIKFTDHGTVTFDVEVVACTGTKLITNTNQLLPVHQLRFHIEDTGIGMTDEQLKKIFLPFEQVGDNLHKSEGTGLGLAISSQILELMGSDLKVESVYGKGTKFWFDLDLPIVDTGKFSLSVEGQKNIIGYEGKTRSILIIDSSWENRFIFANLLSSLGFKLIEVSNLQESLDKMKTEHPDLIIADIAMPEINNLQMMKTMRSQVEFANLVIIASSASVSEYTRQQSQEAGYDDFLAKPVKVEELFNMLQTYLSLKWIYSLNDDSSAKISTTEEIIFPPPTELFNLYQAAKAGYVVGIQEEITRIQQLDKRYTRFTVKVSELIAEFEDEAIVAMIQPHLSY
ncbi:ATP-binding protein [Anabaena sp. CCY 9910]|uniref:ATP-binding protein n=1 Tax=Anabaena sp. CCY 9910 TaxID=3103870 RepID=UPI0039E1AC73